MKLDGVGIWTYVPFREYSRGEERRVKARQGKGKVCALLDERRAMNDDAGQQGSRERATEREKGDNTSLSGQPQLWKGGSFGSRQVTQVAIPDARQIDRIGPWSRPVATVASGPE